MTDSNSQNKAVLGLSDEDFLNLPISEFSYSDKETDAHMSESENSDKDQNTEENITQKSDETTSEKISTDKEDSQAQEDTDSEIAESNAQPEGDTQIKGDALQQDDEKESPETSKVNSKDTKGDTQDTNEFDYKSAYEKVTQPFKANGTEIQVKDPNEIINLMQMGANYHKKMAQLKPNLKIIKMLQNNNMLDIEKINNLIDISNKDPKAITKLVQESGIDFLDIDTDEKSDYKPRDHTVSDNAFELDQVLEDIKNTPTFSRTINVLSKEWDSNSKEAISQNPGIISIINSHMENGVYDAVNSVMQQQKITGKLTGVSDIVAYQMIADSLYKQGVLAEKTPTDSLSKTSQTESKVTADIEKTNRKKAVAPVKNSSVKEKQKEVNYLSLSDEEFQKKFATGIN